MATRGFPTWPWTLTDPADLPAPESLVLDAARAWVEATRIGALPRPAARLVLATEGLTAAAPLLDALLLALACAGAMGCRLCPRIMPVEAAILTAVALAQRGTRREALAFFLRVAPSAAAYRAMGPAIELGLTLRRGGMLLTHPLRATG